MDKRKPKICHNSKFTKLEGLKMSTTMNLHVSTEYNKLRAGTQKTSVILNPIMTKSVVIMCSLS
jgi:hypothetical protein